MKRFKISFILILICMTFTSCNFIRDIHGSLLKEKDENDNNIKETVLTRSLEQDEYKSFETEIIKERYSEKLISLINEERTSNDLALLETNEDLTKAANLRAKEISEAGCFSNIRPDGKDWTTVNNQFDIEFTSAAENIASGYISPRDLFRNLIKKEKTRSTILSSEYNKLGVGVYKKAGTVYWQLLFISDEAFGPIPMDAYAAEVLELTNEERVKVGLSELKTYSSLQHAANKRSKESEQDFNPDHTRPDGKDFYTVLGEYNINYNLAGENIAKGQLTPEEVVEGWMNSLGHRDNILNDSFNNMGVGVYQYDGVIYWTQLFTN